MLGFCGLLGYVLLLPLEDVANLLVLDQWLLVLYHRFCSVAQFC